MYICATPVLNPSRSISGQSGMVSNALAPQISRTQDSQVYFHKADILRLVLLFFGQIQVLAWWKLDQFAAEQGSNIQHSL